MTTVADVLELHESECYDRSGPTCVCAPLNRRNTREDWIVMTLPGVGRFVWSPVLMDLRFVARGAQREAARWLLSEKENTVEGVRRVAARRARDVVYDRPWAKAGGR